MKKLLCVPIVMCFSLLLLELAANILCHSLTISLSVCICPESLRMSTTPEERYTGSPTRNASMHTNFFASQNVSCKRNESKFYSRISYYASVSRHRAKWTPKSLMKMLLVYLAEYSPRNIAANLPDCTQQLVQ